VQCGTRRAGSEISRFGLILNTDRHAQANPNIRSDAGQISLSSNGRSLVCESTILECVGCSHGFRETLHVQTVSSADSEPKLRDDKVYE